MANFDRIQRTEHTRQLMRGDFPLLPLQPTKVLGLDPLYGGDMHSLAPAPVRGNYVNHIMGMSSESRGPFFSVQRWDHNTVLSWENCVSGGILLGGLHGLTLGVGRCAANWALAILTIPLYPLMKSAQTNEVIFPTSRQILDYARFRFNQKYGLHALWNKFTQKTLTPILPIPRAVQVRLETEKKARIKQWLDLHSLHFLEIERNFEMYQRYPVKPKFVNLSWFAPRFLAHTWTSLRNWYNNHPIKIEADYYRIQNRLMPNQGLPIRERIGMFLRHYAMVLQGPYHAITTLYTWSYATQHVRDGYRRGPFSLALISMCFWIIPTPFKYLHLDDSVTLTITVFTTYHFFMWFWGERPLKPQFPPRNQWFFYFMLAAVSLELSHLFIQITEAGWSSPSSRVAGPRPDIQRALDIFSEPVHEDANWQQWRNWDLHYDFKKKKTEFDRQKAKSYETLWSKEHLFPGEGWDPFTVTIKDTDGEIRKIKLFSKEWALWETSAFYYGSLKTAEELSRSIETDPFFGDKKETVGAPSKPIIEQLSGKPRAQLQQEEDSTEEKKADLE